MRLEMSELPKTWILDLDGTIVKHNGYKMDGEDTLLEGARDLLSNVGEKDLVILITSREIQYKEKTEVFLKKNGIKYDQIIYNAPFGERILINDNKPSGLKMAYAINTNRDVVTKLEVAVNKDL